MLQPSKAELARQIDREGKRWGLKHMISSYGDVLVAELVPVAIPLGNGVTVVEKCIRDVCAMSTSYPFSSVLRNRIGADKRKVATALEIAHENELKQQKSRQADIDYAIGSDLREIRKGTIRIGGF
jgi:hypothetical protein